MKNVLLTSIGLALSAVVPAAAQQAAAAPAAPVCPAGMKCEAVPLPSSTLGLFPFPAKEQTKEQQRTDEDACYAWAKGQTGIDPALVKANPDSAAKAAQAKMDSAATGAAVVGAAKGAAAGALIGAAAGDAGKGAAVGATAGAIGGRRAKKQAVAQAGAQGAASANAKADEMMTTFKKAFTSCITGKGYTVS